MELGHSSSSHKDKGTKTHPHTHTHTLRCDYNAVCYRADPLCTELEWMLFAAPQSVGGGAVFVSRVNRDLVSWCGRMIKWRMLALS